jgi:hypothetical protein
MFIRALMKLFKSHEGGAVNKGALVILWIIVGVIAVTVILVFAL